MDCASCQLCRGMIYLKIDIFEKTKGRNQQWNYWSYVTEVRIYHWFTDRKRLERGQVSRTETVEAGDKRFLCFSSGKSKRYSLLTLKKMTGTATECDWLKEFDVFINRPDVTDRKIIPWDWLPQDWTMDERFYQYDHWFENERIQDSDVKEYYDHVTGKFWWSPG